MSLRAASSSFRASSLSRGRRGGVGRSGRRRARLDEAVQRREGLDLRQGEPRALEREGRTDKAASAPARRSPRPRRGRARAASAVADGAAEGGAGQQAASDPRMFAGGAQAFDGLVEPGGRSVRIGPRRLGQGSGSPGSARRGRDGRDRGSRVSSAMSRTQFCDRTHSNVCAARSRAAASPPL